MKNEDDGFLRLLRVLILLNAIGLLLSLVSLTFTVWDAIEAFS